MVTGLEGWAAAWGIPLAALEALPSWLLVTPMGDGEAGASESRATALVRADAVQNGVWLTRNNVGALVDSRGVPVRYGLANESKAQNQVIKSADLIGIRPLKIHPCHVGSTIGQFVSREVKRPGWEFTGKGREKAQFNWLLHVNKLGGDAKFCTGPGTF